MKTVDPRGMFNMGNSQDWSLPRVGASVIIRLVDGALALIRRSREPGTGRWAVPGGFVELGERVEETVKREAREETGLDIDDLSLLGVFDIIRRDEVRVGYHYVTVCYRAGRVEGVLKAGPDVLEARWFLPKDLTEEMLTETTRRILREAEIL